MFRIKFTAYDVDVILEPIPCSSVTKQNSIHPKFFYSINIHAHLANIRPLMGTNECCIVGELLLMRYFTLTHTIFNCSL
jgi:hypothetical protein